MGELVDRARDLAQRAHAGQVDKAGRPYIEHVSRVAAAVRGDETAETAAWLHDVLEDQPQYEAELETFPADVQEAVRLLTRTPGVPQEPYYAAIREHPVALAVKLADIADNSDPARLAMVAPEHRERLSRKYSKARRLLLDPDQ